MGEKLRQEDENPPKKDWSFIEQVLAEIKVKEEQVNKDTKEHEKDLLKRFPDMQEQHDAYKARMVELQRITEKRRRGKPLTKEERDLLEKPEMDAIKRWKNK